MNTFMNWLADSFVPKSNKILSKPWISALGSTMQKVIPFILTGSVIFLYNVLVSFFPSLPDLGPISDFSFGIILPDRCLYNCESVYGKAGTSELYDQRRYRFHRCFPDGRNPDR